MDFFVAIALSLVALAALQLLQTRYSGDLSRIPGPFLASFSNLWKISAVYHGEMPTRNVVAHQKYGTAVRIGPNHVSFASPEALHTIYGSRLAFPKSDFYKATSPIYEGHPLPNLFSLQDVNEHSTLKKNLAVLYTKSAVRDFEPQIDECTMLFVDRIPKGKPADMSLWLRLFSFDCLGEINLSKKFGFLETGTDVRGMIASADRRLHMAGMYSQSPTLLNVRKIITFLWDSKKKNNPLVMYAKSNLEDRRKQPTGSSDMLNKFLKLSDDQPETFSTKQITAAIYINLMAGNDVLAISLRAIFYYRAKSPRVYSRLYEDIRAIDKFPLSRPLPCSELDKLDYLDAIIYEALRIHGNTGLILERVTPPVGAVIDGYKIPGGTIVGCNAWALNRNTEVFGDDVDVFRPERWLDVSSEKKIEMKRNLFSFGAGSRLCIGRHLAVLQIAKVVAEFFRRFKVKLVHPERSWHVHGSWVTKQTDMDMFVIPLEKLEAK